MKTVTYDIVDVRNNATFRKIFSLKSSVTDNLYDFYGHVGDMQVKNGDGEVVLQFSTTDDTISVDSSSKRITLFQTESVMNTIDPGSYVYDLRFTDDDGTEVPVKGKFKVVAGVTDD